jgi:hypothetical protein
MTIGGSNSIHASAIAEALLIPPSPARAAAKPGARTAVLVMDNCEHVLDPIVDAVTEFTRFAVNCF